LRFGDYGLWSKGVRSFSLEDVGVSPEDVSVSPEDVGVSPERVQGGGGCAVG